MKPATIIMLLFVLCVGLFVSLVLTVNDLTLETAALIEAVEQIDRRDRILQVFMGGGWDPACEYERTPDELLADGTVLWNLNKICEEE